MYSPIGHGLHADVMVEGAAGCFYRRLVKAMAAFHGVAAKEGQGLQARSQLRSEQPVAALLADVAIEGVVVDTGFPIPTSSCRRRRSAGSAMSNRSPLLRLEPFFQRLVAMHSS
jgi:hypothetical protein